MHTRQLRRYVIVPLIYVAVIAGLLFLQFSGTLTVRRAIGRLEFVGTLASGEDETSARITRARVLFPGIEIDLSADTPLIVDHETDERRLVPVRYRVDDRAVSIVFDDESEIAIEVPEASFPEIRVTATGTWPVGAVVRLPIAVTSDEPPRLGSTPETRVIAVESETFYLTGPPGSSFSADGRYLDLPSDGQSRLFRYTAAEPEPGAVVTAAFDDGQRSIPDDFYDALLEGYVDTAYRGWSTVRYNGGSGTWQMREGSPRFSEEILTAYLAEAWQRGEFVSAFNQMRRAADLHPEQVGALSTPFLGNLRVVSAAARAQDAATLTEIVAKTRAADATVFRRPDAVHFVATRGTEQMYRAILEFAGQVNERTVDVMTAIGMLANALGPLPEPEAAAALLPFTGVVDAVIVPAVRQFDDLFFVETVTGEIDVFYSIWAGVLLERVGADAERPTIQAAGRNLVLSGLQLADEQGFLPERIYIQEGRLTSREGSFGPERLYTVFSDNPWYPRAASLYGSFGPGSHVWTIVPIVSTSLVDGTFRLEIENPVGTTHYLMVQGVPPFVSMNLFGLLWRNDPTFELYRRGRHYEPTTGTLMIKYTDELPVGEIEITF